MLYLFQKGFHYAQDGPGNRLIYHLQGCPLRCPWCSNPEGLASTGGEGYSVEALADEVMRSRPMFFDGGGVTLTGGEVTMQADGALRLLSLVRAGGVSTCIETNAIFARLPEFFPLVDHLIMDIKHHDPATHKRVTGVSNERAIENLSLAVRAGKEPLVRIPLVGGFNATEKDAEAFARLFCDAGLVGHGSVELLSYHEYGRTKYEKLGIPYTMTGDAFVSGDDYRKFSDVLRAADIKIIKT